jgi:4-diphosphocytidyl-2-C-methyl-D-erythritol kinase
MREPLFALAPAKINLGFEIVGKRADGFHEIVTILQTVSLFDRLTFWPDDAPFEYTSPPAIDPSIDLVRRALQLAGDMRSWRGRLTLDKQIPEAAGLGGGSSDAAAAIRLAIPRASSVRQVAAATSLGSDVPFFLTGGTALATGTGTTLRALGEVHGWVVLVTPRLLIPSKTHSLYGSLEPEDFTDGAAVIEAAKTLGTGLPLSAPPMNAFSRALMSYEAVRAARDALQRAGAPWASVSGAGPTVFTLVERYADAKNIARRIPNGTGVVTLARTIAAESQYRNLQRIAECLRTGAGSH